MIDRADHIRNVLALTELQEKVIAVVTYLNEDPNYPKEDAIDDLLEVVSFIHDLSGDFISPLLNKQKSPSESDQEQ